MEITSLLKLLFAHVLSDFVLQTKGLVEQKKSENIGIRIQANAIHALIHALITYLLLGWWACWWIPLTIFVTHFVIDWLKAGHDTLKAFIIDQCAHVLIILAIWVLYTQQLPELYARLGEVFATDNVWVLLVAYTLITKPASLLITLFTERWASAKNEPEELDKAGQWIGYMERALVLTFVLMQQYEAVGFILAAKSIFRYGDLKEAKDIKMTEYVLIGTLSSFSIAILVGIVAHCWFL